MDPAAIGYGGGACVLGLTMALQNGLPLARANASRRWPTTIGHVRSAKVESYGVSLGKTRYNGCAPVIGFEYTLDGRQYERRAFVGNGSGKFDDAQDALRHYRVGQKVSVRYNPSRPGRAVMAGEYIGGSEVLTFFGCILCIVGALMIASLL